MTGVRAYAALWVMLLHLHYGVGIKGHLNLGDGIRHGFWAVDVFFVLSGFILSLLYCPTLGFHDLRGTYRSYLAARFARIYPLHVATLGVLALLVLGHAAVNGFSSISETFGLRLFVINLLLLHGWGFAGGLNWNYPSWSISTEWFAYLALLPLLCRTLRRAPAGGVLLFGTALWTGLYVLVHHSDRLIGHQGDLWAIPRIVAEFTLGYGLFRLSSAVRIHPLASDALVAAGTLGIIALCYGPVWAEWALAPAVCCLILGLSQAGRIGGLLFGNRVAVFWGERSYSIYMLHAVVQISCDLILQDLGVLELSAPVAWLAFLFQVSLVLAASHYSHGWLELPARRRLRRLLDRTMPRRRSFAPASVAETLSRDAGGRPIDASPASTDA